MLELFAMKRILLVEDDVRLQRLLREELTEVGYEIDLASNGKEALSRLSNGGDQPPDLVIMDIRMPKMDGLEAIGSMLKAHFSVPVIIHTAYARYQQDAMALAADAYVVKSHDSTELLSTIHDLIGK